MRHSLFADVILPFALEKNYTYAIPEEYSAILVPGMRVEVPFRNKVYTGVIAKVHPLKPDGYQPKPILSLPDHLQVIHKSQLDLWQWMADYYMCPIGDVMQAALPAAYKLSSETVIVYHPNHGVDVLTLDEKEFLVAEALSIHNELALKDIQLIVQQKTIQPIIKALIGLGIASVKEELKEVYIPKTEKYVVLDDAYASEEGIQQLFEQLQKHEKQVNVLMIYYQLSTKEYKVKRSVLLRRAGVTAAVLKTMVKNGIFHEVDEQVSRLGEYTGQLLDDLVLNEAQQKALTEIQTHWKEKQVVLLHGVTGSGKTEIYIECIKEAVEQGKQVLYLLPEIALTAQIIARLKRRFGSAVGIYHSKFNQHERVEIWQQVLNGTCRIMLGARSAVFLPFNQLGLVIVDEEHDASYKQYEPNPRYHGRDTAIYLARIHGAKTILGTATPSIESYYHAKQQKYGLVELVGRYAEIEMPEVRIVDVKAEEAGKQMQSHFSSVLKSEIQLTLDQKEQVILFQNRRGYAPFLLCESCGWTPQCVNCDVNMVYHKYANELKCHYCNYTHQPYATCPACGSARIVIKGFGTERIEDDLHYIFPDARTARLDLDTVRTKHGHEKIVKAFEEGGIDILTGTQMVTKGLDFDHVRLVGILSADQLINFADFRAAERAFQMLTQVSGRAGRKHRRGLVVIQAIKTDHPVLQYVVKHDFKGFYDREIAERQQFGYPPFTRLIRLTLKHASKDLVHAGAHVCARGLREQLGERVLGPALPVVPRIRNRYLMEILIKYPSNSQAMELVKQTIKAQLAKMDADAVYKRVDIAIDVDPL
ncbi:MAG TPA: primosomal protein N' [Chitinophagales bacterium]|nr:primosomal protein N' [Chitinophagales bacterium]